MAQKRLSLDFEFGMRRDLLITKNINLSFSVLRSGTHIMFIRVIKLFSLKRYRALLSFAFCAYSKFWGLIFFVYGNSSNRKEVWLRFLIMWEVHFVFVALALSKKHGLSLDLLGDIVRVMSQICHFFLLVSKRRVDNPSLFQKLIKVKVVKAWLDWRFRSLFIFGENGVIDFIGDRAISFFCGRSLFDIEIVHISFILKW